MEDGAKRKMIAQLKEKIMTMEGFKAHSMAFNHIELGLEVMRSAFPFRVFPIGGAVHEFVSPTAACATASNGFISGILSSLMKDSAYCLWVSTKRSLFPGALAAFGIQPDQVIFVDVKQDKDVLWVMEQGLKCEAFVAVVAELGEVTFSESQRLQLAVEKSRVTGFLHRRRPRSQQALACVTRWKIRSAPSDVYEELPGVGHPVWEVHLEKVKNGRPGKWHFGWRNRKFVYLPAYRDNQKVVRQWECYG